MKNWEIQYKHAKAVRDAQCKSRGIDIPNDEHGVLKTIEGLWNKFDGRLFWFNLKQMGHTSMEFNKCDCNKTEQKDYLLMIKVPIKAIDDIDARMKLSEIKKNPKFYIHNGEIKLQEIFKGQPPRHVII